MEGLAAEIDRCLNEYSDNVSRALEETKKDLSKQAVKSLKASSPRKTGKYARSWTKKKRGRAIIVHNKEYQLTHLLEKGHAKRGGGRVSARVHIAPVERSLHASAESIFRRKLP